MTGHSPTKMAQELLKHVQSRESEQFSELDQIRLKALRDLLVQMTEAGLLDPKNAVQLGA